MLQLNYKSNLSTILVLGILTVVISFAEEPVVSSSPMQPDTESNTIGILGGMGPHSSADFYLDVIDEYLNHKKTRPSMLLWNVPLNLQKEERFIEQGEFKDYYLEKLIDGARHLKEGNADFVAIPCNTVHIFFDELEQQVDIRFLSIIDETTKYLARNNVKNTLLLATSTTIKSKLYSNALDDAGIEVYLPSEEDQLRVDHTIVNIVNRKETITDQEILEEIIGTFEQKGAGSVLLACTDLQELIKQDDHQITVYDTMNILVSATVAEAMKD